MKIIGITGGAGAGKSQVLSYLEKEYGAFVCQADLTARDLQQKGTECFQRIVDHFGTDVVDENGDLNRQKLAGIVFSSRPQLRILNEIVHPAVKEKIREIIRTQADRGTKLFALEAALFIEENYEDFCDEVWYIYADEETRRKRLTASRGYSSEKIQGIFDSQMPSSEFFAHCDRAVDNCHSFQETCDEIDDMMAQIGIHKITVGSEEQ